MPNNNAARPAAARCSTSGQASPRPPTGFSPECTLLFEPLQRNNDSRDRQATALHDLLETERAPGHCREDSVIEGAARLGSARRSRCGGRPGSGAGSRPRACLFALARTVARFALPRAWARRSCGAARRICGATRPIYGAAGLGALPGSPTWLCRVVENTQRVEDILGATDRDSPLVQQGVGADRGGVLDRARYRADLYATPDSRLHCVPGTPARVAFHNHHHLRQPRNDAVAGREPPGLRR